MEISVTLTAHHAELIATPAHAGEEVRFQTAGATPAYGLADHAIEQKQFSTLPNKQFNTDVTGFRDDAFLPGRAAAGPHPDRDHVIRNSHQSLRLSRIASPTVSIPLAGHDRASRATIQGILLRDL